MKIFPTGEKAVEWVYRGLVFAGIVGMMFLNSRFASKEDVEAVKQSIIDLKMKFVETSESTRKIDDHESRIRALERRETREFRAPFDKRG